MSGHGIVAVSALLLLGATSPGALEAQEVTPPEWRAAELYHLAREASSRGEEDRAIRWLQEAVFLDEDAILPRLELAELQLGRGTNTWIPALLDPIAARVMARADSAPGEAAAWYRLRAAWRLRGGDRDEAARLYERASQYAPHDWGLRSQLVSLHRQRGDVAAEALHLAALAVMSPASVEIQVALADALRRMERWEESEEAFREAIAAGGSPRAWEGLGDVLLETGRAAEALSAYRRVEALFGATPTLTEKIERARSGRR